jgi:hypothetical protein
MPSSCEMLFTQFKILIEYDSNSAIPIVRERHICSSQEVLFQLGYLQQNRFQWAESHCGHVPALFFFYYKFYIYIYIYKFENFRSTRTPLKKITYIYINLRILEVASLEFICSLKKKKKKLNTKSSPNNII